MPDSTPLSPAAQAVLAAVEAHGKFRYRNLAAAALRAVADQVAPSDLDEPRNNLPAVLECQRIRRELLAIAAELN